MMKASALTLMWLLTTPMTAAVHPGVQLVVPPMTPLAASGFVSRAAYPLNRLDRIAGSAQTGASTQVPASKPSAQVIVEAKEPPAPPPVRTSRPVPSAAVLTEANPEVRRDRRSRRRQPRWAGYSESN